MATAQVACLRVFRRTFDGRYGGRDFALQFMCTLLEVGIPPGRIQITESLICDGNPSVDMARITVWYFSFGEVR